MDFTVPIFTKLIILPWFLVELAYTKFHLHGSGNVEKKGTNSPIPVAVQSETYACSRSIAAIAGSSPAESIDVRVFVACRVGSGLCDGLVSCSVETYRVCVSICVRHGNFEMCQPRLQNHRKRNLLASLFKGRPATFLMSETMTLALQPFVKISYSDFH